MKIKGVNLFLSNLYLYNSEIFRKDMRKRIYALCFVWFDVATVAVNLVSPWFNHYKFYIAANCLGVLGLSFCYYYFVESPFYYFKQKDLSRLKSCLLQICRVNYDAEQFEDKKHQIESLLSSNTSKTHKKLTPNPQRDIGGLLELSQNKTNQDSAPLLHENSLKSDQDPK